MILIGGVCHTVRAATLPDGQRAILKRRSLIARNYIYLLLSAYSTSEVGTGNDSTE